MTIHRSIGAAGYWHITSGIPAEEKFVDTLNRMIRRNDPPTQLQKLRRSIGYSQKMLAEKSGISLRMIQQYEQRAKDINKAAGINLAALSQILGCQGGGLAGAECGRD